MDIGIIMDRSNSIFRGGILKTKVFLNNLVNNFDLSPDGAEMSIIEFNSKVKGLIQFSYNKNNLLNAIDEIKYGKGSTFTGSAIKFFTDKYLKNSREIADKFVIIFTDGKPTKGIKGTSPVDYMMEQINITKSLYPDIKIIIMGLGNYNEILLNEITPFVFNINNVNNFIDILYSLTELICTDGVFTRRPSNVPSISPTQSPLTCSSKCEINKNKKQCNNDECGCIWKKIKNGPNCKLLTPSPTQSPIIPTLKPTESPITCSEGCIQNSNNKNKCNNNNCGCIWKKVKNKPNCKLLTPSPTQSPTLPTKSPTISPTQSPIILPCELLCKSKLNKVECLDVSKSERCSCNWKNRRGPNCRVN